MDMNELLDPFARMLVSAAPAEAIRAVEGGDTARAAAMWQDVAASGFLDALVPESAGGAGLTLADAEPLIEAVGAAALPLPLAETMVARALLAQAGVAAPEGPVALVTSLAQPVPCALVASHALIDTGTALVLAELAALSPVATGVKSALSARISAPTGGVEVARPADGLRPIAAVIRAALIAGAAARLTDMATGYANERVQFGKPIGKQQVLQQMLAVMAEDMIACRIAAQLGCSQAGSAQAGSAQAGSALASSTQGIAVPLAVAATAKATASAAAPRIAATAHAVHGAIGISEEYDLQLLTRRLHEWRLADGSEGFWAQALGTARLSSDQGTVEWVRAEVFAS